MSDSNFKTIITSYTGKYGFMWPAFDLPSSKIDLTTISPAFLNAVEKLITNDTTYNTIISNLRKLKASHPDIKLDMNTNVQEDIKNCLMSAPREIAKYVSYVDIPTIFNVSIAYDPGASSIFNYYGVEFYAKISKVSDTFNAYFIVRYFNGDLCGCVLFDCCVIGNVTDDVIE
jgi:hypothetical protein